MLELQYKNKIYTVKQLEEMSGIPGAVIRYRLREGYEVEEAIKDQPLKLSVKKFTADKDWHDWLNRPTQQIYLEYFDYCKSNHLAPENKQTFMHQVLDVYPWLKSESRKQSDGHGVRLFKLEPYDKFNSL